MKTEKVRKFLYKYRTLKKVAPNDWDEALSELMMMEAKIENFENAGQVSQRALEFLMQDYKRLLVILKREDICPVCGGTEASTYGCTCSKKS